MEDDLLSYYNRELTYIRRLAAQFAEAHPKIAARLRLGPDTSEDPHVERLIEAFAYLTARIRLKLEDDFPEISESLLNILYPHYQAPIPSMAIVQLELDREQNDLLAGHTVPRHTAIETEPIQGEPVRFRTCYAVTLWPVDLQTASLTRPPFAAPVTPCAHEAAAVVRLSLRCRGRTVRFDQLQLDRLRFFLKGQSQHVYRLYEFIFNNLLEIALANGPDDPRPVLLDRKAICPVGFERDEGMLPYSPRSFVGYRLLSEFFAFPQKFLFFDLNFQATGGEGRGEVKIRSPLSARPSSPLQGIGNQLDIYFYLNQTASDLEQNVSTDTFRLGCTPVVNLYPHRAEPIQLTHTEYEYRLVPDARRPLAHEVYSIERVTATAAGRESVEFQPFFSVKHAGAEETTRTFWHAVRRPAEQTRGQVDHGTEVYLSFVDLNFQTAAPADWVVGVETTCLNRDLPARLPFGGDQPRLQLSEGSALVSAVRCLTPPTRTFRPALRQGALWRLLSHLSLNHLSLVDTEGRAEPLRELLKLYDFADSPETRKMIDGLLSVRHRRVVGRVPGAGAGAICQGTEVTVHFDPDKFTGSGLYLFACVLERFFALYCTINSFTKFVATVKGREGELRRWPPRMGERVLA